MKYIVKPIVRAMRAAFAYVCRYAIMAWANTIARFVIALRKDASFKRGALATLALEAALIVLLVCGWRAWVVVAEASVGDDDDSAVANSDDDSPLPPITDLRHVGIVRAARARIRPMDKDILPFVMEAYNEYVGQARWKKGAKRCHANRAMFKHAEELTLMPTDYVAGIALHESLGCNMGARDWAGGRGFMQLTHINKGRHVAPMLVMLHRPSLNYNTNPEHNLFVGIMVFDDYERQMGSRSHGLLAYNMGPGGVRKVVKNMGRSTKALPTVAQMRPHLHYGKRQKPRVYVERVLACAVMMRRLAQGKELTRISSLEPSDIPGFYPKDDGAQLASRLK